MLNFATNFGDQAVLLPLAMLIASMSVFNGWPRGAVGWSLIFVTMSSVMVGLKVVVYSFSRTFACVDVSSPSGHTAASTLVYGGLLVMLTRASPVRALCAAASVATFMGTTRVMLTVHTIPDVLVGAAVGLTALTALIRLVGPSPRSARSMPQLLALLILAAVGAATNMHLPAETWIRHLRLT